MKPKDIEEKLTRLIYDWDFFPKSDKIAKEIIEKVINKHFIPRSRISEAIEKLEKQDKDFRGTEPEKDAMAIGYFYALSDLKQELWGEE